MLGTSIKKMAERTQKKEGKDGTARNNAPAAAIPEREGQKGEPEDQEPRGVSAVPTHETNTHIAMTQ